MGLNPFEPSGLTRLCIAWYFVNDVNKQYDQYNLEIVLQIPTINHDGTSTSDHAPNATTNRFSNHNVGCLMYVPKKTKDASPDFRMASMSSMIEAIEELANTMSTVKDISKG
jgi:hypothetical protein